MEPETQKKSNGALVGSIIVIIILVIGGLYLWKNIGNKGEAPTIKTDLKDIQGTPDGTTSSIEAELDNIDLDSLDSDL
jgi:uncharacterized protein YxeA